MFASKDATAGGGPYDDDHVDDEFYWAAVELFVTTGEDTYKKAMLDSPFHKDLPKADSAGETPTPMSWGSTAMLGTITLAVVPNALDKSEVQAARRKIITLADAYVEAMAHQGYRVVFAHKSYPWGSSSDHLNNMIILGLASDFTHDRKYLDAMATGMDYILGRNPLDQSYITGYGSRPLKNPHHRFFCPSYNETYPPPPPGFVSGGPNSGLQDPQVRAAGLPGCAPMACFIDHVEAWSVNEVAINWNAPLAWVAAYLDESESMPLPDGAPVPAIQSAPPAMPASAGGASEPAAPSASASAAPSAASATPSALVSAAASASASAAPSAKASASTSASPAKAASGKAK
jgi:endoglucanase